MPQKQKQKRKTKRRASQVKVLTQTTKQNVIVNIIKPTRKVRNKPYQGVPQIRRIEYISTYGLGNALYKQPVINQPQAQPQARPQPQLERQSSAAQGSRTQRGTLYDLSFRTPPRGGAAAYESEPARYDPRRGRVLQRRTTLRAAKDSSSDEEVAGAAPKFVD